MKKIIVLLWFAVCLVLFGVVLNPLVIQRTGVFSESIIQSAQAALRPYFFRKSLY